MRRQWVAITAGAVLGLGLVGCGDNDALDAGDRERASQAALAAVGGGNVTDASRGDDDDGYAYEVEVTFENGEDVDVELDEDFNVTNNPPKVNASDTPSASPTPAPSPSASRPTINDDAPLTGQTLERASAAALKATGGGRVTDSSRSDDADHAYEVEVSRVDNGEDIDVELDENFKVTQVDR